MTVYNFGAGPAMLPAPVLERAREELCDWRGTGMSVMEVSHRSPEFVELAARTEADLRAIMGIPADYRVLFLQGGAVAQFALIPMNLLGDRTRADYLRTGLWSAKAIKEASAYCKVNVACCSEESGYTTIPDPAVWRLDPKAGYVYYCANESINGVEFPEVPQTAAVPLVADMTSNILSRPVDVSRFGLIFASAQKNVGPAGLTLVIVREDLLGHARTGTPSVFDYGKQAASDSMYNTPPTFAWYVAGLVFEWIEAQGGVEGLAERNGRKADRLYRAIDASDFYRNEVDARFRSCMNVPFRLADSALDKRFLTEAEAAGLVALKGHRSVGGMRASIYNAMPEAGVEALVEYMADFERRRA